VILRPFGSTVLSFTVVALLWATAVWAVQDSAAVALVVKDIRTAPGRQIEIGIEQSGRDLPSGYFYTVAAVATLYPGSQEPEILPGYPVTRLTCRSPGQYVIRIGVHLVNKTSCGGASFETVLEDDVRISVVE